MKRVPANRYFLFFGTAIFGCLADLWTKHVMFRDLGMPSGREEWVIQDVFGFQTSLNEGALFGMGQGMVPVFVVLSAVAAVSIIVWLFGFKAARDKWLTLFLGMIMAGVFGNLYDRLGVPNLEWNYANDLHQVGEPVYAVRDWILVMIGDYHWPNFNIADMLLVCGAVLLSAYSMFGKFEEEGESPDKSEKKDEKK
jgi:signal peptidase II